MVYHILQFGRRIWLPYDAPRTINWIINTAAIGYTKCFAMIGNLAAVHRARFVQVFAADACEGVSLTSPSVLSRPIALRRSRRDGFISSSLLDTPTSRFLTTPHIFSFPDLPLLHYPFLKPLTQHPQRWHLPQGKLFSSLITLNQFYSSTYTLGILNIALNGKKIYFC